MMIITLLFSSWLPFRFDGDPYHMPAAPARGNGADRDSPCLESAVGEAAGKDGIVPGGPDAEDAARGQGSEGGFQSVFGIKAVIGVLSQPCRTVVHIQENGVKSVCLRIVSKRLPPGSVQPLESLHPKAPAPGR